MSFRWSCVSSTSDRLLGGLPLADLRPVELAAGAELYRQGQRGDALYTVEQGSLVVAARLPGGREVELATLREGDVVGELALLDGGARSATVRALEPTRVLRLARAEFHALVSRRDEAARTLRRRLLVLACTRLRDRRRALAASLPGQPLRAPALTGEPAQLPALPYLARLPFFRGYDAEALGGLLARARVERVSPGAVLVAEGGRPRSLFVTLNGAVEEAIRRAESTIRVALAGPGCGFGYACLLAGGEATATAAARERSLVLAVEPVDIDELLADENFATAIERDVVRALRQAERPQARLAAAHSSS
jgi:CRP-like cAMP-binding protein